MLMICVEVHSAPYSEDGDIYRDHIKTYTMDHDDPSQRRVLGQQCRYAFEAGQKITTYPAKGV